MFRTGARSGHRANPKFSVEDSLILGIVLRSPASERFRGRRWLRDHWAPACRWEAEMASTVLRAEILLQIETCDLLLAQSEGHILRQQGRVDAMTKGSSDRNLSEEILATLKSLLR